MGKRILLVEDHADTRMVFDKFLTKSGYQVVAVENKALALAACENTDFDILIADIRLPDGSGLDLMRELRQKCRLKGIAFTGFGLESDIAEIRTAGFAASLIKPANLHLMAETIERLLREQPSVLN